MAQFRAAVVGVAPHQTINCRIQPTAPVQRGPRRAILRRMDTIYRVLPRPGGGFLVELIKPGTLPRTAEGFSTVAEAQAWIARDKRMEAHPPARLLSRGAGSRGG